MPDEVQQPTDVNPNDIVFNCPHCGKSLAIDGRGAGLLVTCPDCGQRVEVPFDQEDAGESLPAGEERDPEARIKLLSDALSDSQAKVHRLTAGLDEFRERRRYLEKLRSDNLARFEQIGKEIETIQNALDRIVALLQDAAAEQQPADES